MAGIGRPYSLGQIVGNIKARHPEIPIQYHSHAGPGFNMASILEVCKAGCDYIDVGMEPLSWVLGMPTDLCSGHAEGCGLYRSRDQYGSLYEGTQYDPRSLWMIFLDYIQSQQPLNELTVDLELALPGGMMEVDGGFGNQPRNNQQE